MGSVKSLRMINEPTENEMGRGVFVFSDDYSVFDYGKMPDIIPDKGASLCAMAAYNFKKLEELGYKSHFVRLVKPNEMEVKLVRKITSDLSEEINNRMIPLEIIFRDVLGDGSSVFRRLKKGEITYQDFGLDHYPTPEEKLEKPIIEFSTKYEPVDRYFKTIEEARGYAKISENKINELRNQALSINHFLRQRCNELGWVHLDGKVEAGLDPQGNIVWVDAFGTLDEDRFECKGLKLSKQIMRNYYRTTPWYEELNKAKDSGVDPKNWPKPERLPEELVSFTSDIYKTAANLWTGEEVFKNAKSMDELFKELEELKSKGVVR